MQMILSSVGVFLALKGFPYFVTRFGEFLCKSNWILSVYRGLMFAWLYGVAFLLIYASSVVRFLIKDIIQNSVVLNLTVVELQPRIEFKSVIEMTRKAACNIEVF